MLERFFENAWQVSQRIFFNPGSGFSLASLAVAFLIALAAYAFRVRARGYRLRWKLMRRLVLPKRLFMSASGKADILYFVLNGFIMAATVGSAIVAGATINSFVASQLVATFGPPPARVLPDWLSRTVLTLVLFLAYEFAYWFDHYLSHRYEFLWQFHKVHTPPRCCRR